MSSSDRQRDVRLEVAAGHRELRLIRQLIGAIASLSNYDIEAIEDLRIAVDEGCVWLIEQGDGSPLVIEALTTDGAIELTGTTRRAATNGAKPGEDTGDSELSRLVELILSASCEEYTLDRGGDQARFWIRAKPRTEIDDAR